MSTSRRPVVTLVVNPAAGRGRATTVGQAVARDISGRCSLTVAVGTSWQQSVALLRRAAAQSDTVLVCGGDGLVHLAVNVLAEGDVPLGVVPAGTGNDTAEVLGWPADPVAAARALVFAATSGAVQRIDLGLVTGPFVEPLVPGSRGRWFVGMLYAGLDAAVNETANTLRRPRGARRYDVAIALEMLKLRPRRVSIGLDGQVSDREITLVAVGNGPQYGGGKRMVPDARWDDGVFDIAVIGAVSRVTIARLAPKLPKAGHVGHPAVGLHRAAQVSLDGDTGPAYADGERVGLLPVLARCVPSALPVLNPGSGTW
jgi:diacylglycerol kinase (ATP)